MNDKSGPKAALETTTTRSEISVDTDTDNQPQHGGDIALATADIWWLHGAELLIAQLAVQKPTVCACDITDNDTIGLPDHPCRLGAAFRRAAQAGVIRRVGYHSARRAARQGGVHAVWAGAR